MTEEEKEENIQQLIAFLNSCISASKTIELKDSAIERSFRDYKIMDTNSAISFIKDSINIIGMCKKQQLGYGKIKDAPYAYEYVFQLKNEPNNLGCLSFHKNPKKQNKIKFQIKSLHKDYQDVIPNQKNEKIDIVWLNQNQIDELPICKGDKNEVSIMS